MGFTADVIDITDDVFDYIEQARTSHVSGLAKIFVSNAREIDSPTPEIERTQGSYVTSRSGVFKQDARETTFDGELAIEQTGDEKHFNTLPKLFVSNAKKVIVSALPKLSGDNTNIIVFGVGIDFHASPRWGAAPLSVRFYNDSYGAAEQFRWSFGDGERGETSEPAHIYQRPGIYTVTFQGLFDGEWYTITKPRYIIVYGGGLVVSRTNRCFQMAVVPSQGIKFIECTGAAFPMPEAGHGTLLIWDDDGQPHMLVLDNKDGRWWDMATRDGPTGSGLVKVHKDKVALDGSGGTNIVPLIRFGEVIGTYEHYWVRHIMSYLFFRTADNRYAGAAGFDAQGFPIGLEINVAFYVDDNRVIPERSVLNISRTGGISTDDFVEGHRIAIEVTANMAPFKLIGYKGDYKISDIPTTDGMMTEDGFQEELADLASWFSRGLKDIDRATGGSMDEDEAEKLTLCIGPDGEENSATQFTDTVVYPSVTLTGGQSIMLWHQGLSGLFVGNTEITLTQYDTSGGWILSYARSITATGAVSLVPSGTGKVFDRRIFNSNISDSAVEYYFNNVVDKAGDVVLP